MKKYLLFAFTALAALLTGCSDSAVEAETSPEISDGTPRYISVTIGNSNRLTRDAVYIGSNPKTENAIKDVRFYFFDKDGNPANVKSGVLGNYYKVTNLSKQTPTNIEDGVNTNTGNIDMTYSAVLVINTAEGDKLPVQMVAVCNTADALGSDSKSLQQLYDVVADYAATTANIAPSSDGAETLGDDASGLVMASSVYALNKVKKCPETVTDKIKDSQAAAEGDPVDVYVERVVAKVKVSVDGDQLHALTAAPTGKTYTPLNDVYATGEHLTKNQLDELLGLNATAANYASEDYWKDKDDNIYVKLSNWYVTAETDKSYLFKSINAEWEDANIFDNWNASGVYRCFWAINPTTAAVGYHDYSGGVGVAGTYTQGAFGANFLYTQENAATNNNGTYGNDTRTQVLVMATIGYQNKDGEFEALNYAEWAGQKFIVGESQWNLKEAILSNLNRDDNNPLNIYKAKEGETLNANNANTYQQISWEDVDVVTASGTLEDGEQANPTATTRYNNYIQLKTTPPATTWYKIEDDPANEGQKKATTLNNNDINADFKAAGLEFLYWNGGKTYYFFKIRHLGSRTGTGADGEPYVYGNGYWGVVRNHIYDCKLTGIVGLGTPVFAPNEVIIPETVERKNSYIAAQINVLSWRVVTNDYQLGQ